MKPIVSIHNLGKKYLIPHEREPYLALRDVISKKLKDWMRLRFKPGRPKTEEIWALKDVSLEINQGDKVGIIGRNGAGKTTLLKIMSRITEPSKGRITLRGKVASLLEVGTGFHPELTGRENIFLNGAILGMSRADIMKRFDAIVSFSEVEKFLDTPMKHYSSGMYVRLAFAVAAHLEPDILLVDEVLAVGDAQFQKKCLGKMDEINKEGRTLIFVSHNMGAVRYLCTRCVLMEKGTVDLDSTPEEVINHYLLNQPVSSGYWERKSKIPDRSGVYFQKIYFTDAQGNSKGDFDYSNPFYVHLECVATKDSSNVLISLRITNQEGIAVFTSANADFKKSYPKISKGNHHYQIEIPKSFLMPGQYNVMVGTRIPNVEAYDFVQDLNFKIEDSGSHISYLHDGRLGVVTPVLEWKEEACSTDVP